MSDGAVATGAEEIGNLREVRNAVQVGDGLLGAEGAVEIAADPDVPRVAGDLADAVDVIDDGVERHAGPVGRRLATDPTRHEHPGVERGADHGAAADQARICSSLNCRLCGTSARQFEWLAQTGP